MNKDTLNEKQRAKRANLTPDQRARRDASIRAHKLRQAEVIKAQRYARHRAKQSELKMIADCKVEFRDGSPVAIVRAELFWMTDSQLEQFAGGVCAANPISCEMRAIKLMEASLRNRLAELEKMDVSK